MTVPQLTSTRTAGTQPRLNILVHGPSGAGKTYLARTTGDHGSTLVISAERGLLTLRDVEIPVLEVHAFDELQGAYRWLKGGDHAFNWLIIDSISEVAAQCLALEKSKTKDGRQAYGEMQDRIGALVRAFTFLPLHVVMLARQSREQDHVGRWLFVPDMPGRKLAQGISYHFDEVFALRADRAEDGAVRRYLQTAHDDLYEAKDRSGALALHEPPDLAAIATKILDQGGTDGAL